MKKKFWLVLLSCLTCVLFLCGASGCGKEKHEHDYKQTLTQEATCQVAGEYRYVCDCGDVLRTEVIPKLNHTGGEATCEEEGVCKVCSTPYINCLGHDGGKATCTALAVCERCGKPYGKLVDHIAVNGKCTECEKPCYTENLDYTLNEDGTGYVVKVGYKNTDTEIYIPETYNELPVLEIGGFKGQSITKIVIPSSVKKICKSAFENCEHLKQVTLSEGLETIAEFAFKNSALESIIVPASVTVIEQYAFYTCKALETVTFAENSTLDTVADSCFYGCSSLSSVSLPASVTAIEDYAFYGCSSLSSVSLPASVTTIEDYAFYGCSSLSSVSLPANVTTIGGYAFFGCELQKIDFPEKLTLIGSRAFSGNKFTELTIPANVTEIGSGAFYKCGDLVSITLPFIGVNREGYLKGTYREAQFAYIFDSSSGEVPQSLKKVVLTESTKIASSAFYGCSKLLEIELPNSLKEIGNGAFRGCSRLYRITLPSSLSVILDNAFDGCYSLVEIENASNCNLQAGSTFYGRIAQYAQHIYHPLSGESRITYSDDYVFFDYDIVTYTGKETEIVLPSYRTDVRYDIRPYAFNSSSIASVEIPENVENIGRYAFGNCSSLTSVTYLENNIYYDLPFDTIDEYAFANCTALQELILPATAVDINEGAFSGCESLTELQLPQGVALLPYRAFENCKNLQTIVIPESVKEMNKTAFDGCDKLREEENGVVYVGKWVVGFNRETIADDPQIRSDTIGFAGNNSYVDQIENVKTLVIPDSVRYLSRYALYAFTKLETLTTPVKDMYQKMRTSCLKNLTLNADIVNAYDFQEIKTLESVYFSKKTKIIWEGFYNCTALKTLTFEPGIELEQVSWSAFKDTAFYNDELNWENGVLYCGEVLLRATSTVSGEYKIKDGTTVIADYAFDGNKQLTNVVFPDGLRVVGRWAFDGCSGLEKLQLPSSVTSVPQGAFYGCSFKEATIPTAAIASIPKADLIKLSIVGGDTIEEGAFSGATLLSDITVDTTLKSVGANAFTDTAFYKDETNWENGVLYIGTALVRAQASLAGACIVKTATTCIADGAFDGCTGLTKIEIPETVLDVGESAFNGCTGLTDATLPTFAVALIPNENLQTVKVFGTGELCDYAFSGSKALESVTLESGILKIGKNAFDGCVNLKSVIIPDGVTEIGDYAFNGCMALTEIEIPNSVVLLGRVVFGNCESLKYEEYENAYYLGNKNNPYFVLVKAKTEDVGTCNVHSDTKFIYDSAFSYCKKLKKVLLPVGLTTIGEQAFSYCGLTEIEIPNSVSYIGAFAFNGCDSLQTVKLYEGLVYIGRNAFDTCGLTSVVIPDSVTYLGESAFAHCVNLTSVKMSANVSVIGNRTFFQCEKLVEVEMTDSVKIIYDEAFQYCSAFDSVYYKGDAKSWKKVVIDTLENERILSATVYFYSENAPTEEGNYWHYDEQGNVVVW